MPVFPKAQSPSLPYLSTLSQPHVPLVPPSPFSPPHLPVSPSSASDHSEEHSSGVLQLPSSSSSRTAKRPAEAFPGSTPKEASQDSVAETSAGRSASRCSSIEASSCRAESWGWCLEEVGRGGVSIEASSCRAESWEWSWRREVGGE